MKGPTGSISRSLAVRQIARDARKAERKEKWRSESKNRNFDRKTKEMLAEDELAVLQDAPSTGDEALWDESLALLFEEELALFEQRKQRSSKRDRLLAFAMARHKRLGAGSAAYGVSKDVCSVIASFVPGCQVIVAGGYKATSATGSDDEQVDEYGRRFKFTETREMSEWDFARNIEYPLPPLPDVVIGGQLLHYEPKNELWCVGGSSRDARVLRTSAFVFSFASQEWRIVQGVISCARQGGQSVIFRNMLLVNNKTFGGFMHSGHSAPDEAYCLDGKPLWKLPQREVSTGLNRVSVLLLNSIIIVGASGFLGYERRSDDVVPCCALFCDLQMKHPVWRKFPGWNMSQSRFSAVVFGGEMMLLGGTFSDRYATFPSSSRSVTVFDVDAGKWVDAQQGLAFSVMDACPVIRATRGSKELYMMGGCYFSGDEVLPQARLMRRGADGGWEMLENVPFPGHRRMMAAIVQTSM